MFVLFSASFAVSDVGVISAVCGGVDSVLTFSVTLLPETWRISGSSLAAFSVELVESCCHAETKSSLMPPFSAAWLLAVPPQIATAPTARTSAASTDQRARSSRRFFADCSDVKRFCIKPLPCIFKLGC